MCMDDLVHNKLLDILHYFESANAELWDLPH